MNREIENDENEDDSSIYEDANDEEYEDLMPLKEPQAVKEESRPGESQTETKLKEEPSDNKHPVSSVKASVPQPITSPKDEMMATFHSVWQHASMIETDFIAEIWQSIMNEAKVVTWKPKGKSKDYQLDLAKAVSGSHPEVPLGTVVLKQKMTIAFSEEKDSNSSQYVKILSFPDTGFCYRLGVGWLSKDIPIQRILVKENSLEVMCTIEALGQSIEISADDALVFWRKAQWHKPT